MLIVIEAITITTRDLFRGDFVAWHVIQVSVKFIFKPDYLLLVPWWCLWVAFPDYVWLFPNKMFLSSFCIELWRRVSSNTGHHIYYAWKKNSKFERTSVNSVSVLYYQEENFNFTTPWQQISSSPPQINSWMFLIAPVSF